MDFGDSRKRMTTSNSQICEGCILVGPLFNEPMRVETARVGGDGIWNVGLVGTQSERFRKVTLSARDIAEKNNLEWVTPGHPLFETLRRHACDKAVETFGKGACFYSLLSTWRKAYRELEERAGRQRPKRGSKTELVEYALRNLLSPFGIADVERLCPNVSRDTIRLVMNRWRAEGTLEILGKGRDAKWRRRGQKA
jgi:hypothetical protein